MVKPSDELSDSAPETPLLALEVLTGSRHEGTEVAITAFFLLLVFSKFSGCQAKGLYFQFAWRGLHKLTSNPEGSLRNFQTRISLKF